MYVYYYDVFKKDEMESIGDPKPMFGACCLPPKRTGLDVCIWSDCGGKQYYNNPYRIPTVKLGIRPDYIISVTIEPNPKIINKSKDITNEQIDNCKDAIKYISRNYDLFLKHYNDTVYEFCDDDLTDALKQRGYYIK